MRDLWLDAELDVPAKPSDAAKKQRMPSDEKGHALHPFVAPRPDFPCSLYLRVVDVVTAMRGCTECFFFACAACFLKAVDNDGAFEVIAVI